MKRTFALVAGFDRAWQASDLGDDELVDLQSFLLSVPDAGAVIVGAHGVRKLRWNLPGRGKRGGLRIFYVDFPRHEVLYLLALLRKSQADDIDGQERAILASLVRAIENALQRERQ